MNSTTMENKEFSFAGTILNGFLMLFVNRGKFPVPLENLLVLKQYKGRTLDLDVSISTEAKDITFVSERLQSFFLEQGAPSKVAYTTALCTEEIAADYLEHRTNEGRDGKTTYMDIKAFRDAGQIEIILRNYDEPYNPLSFERKEGDVSKIGITMVQKIAKNITYGYSYHLNVVTIIIADR